MNMYEDNRSQKRKYNDVDNGSSRILTREDILGDYDKFNTRILTTSRDLSKIIGKGGEIVKNIRSNFGVTCRGLDIESDVRIALIGGVFDKVVAAFDHVIDLLFPVAESKENEEETKEGEGSNSSVSGRVPVIQILIEHNKAGKLIGTQGATIQALKSKSGANIVRMNKEPRDYYGAELRTLTIEGTPAQIKKVHVACLELLSEIVATPSDRQSNQRPRETDRDRDQRDNYNHYGMSQNPYAPPQIPMQQQVQQQMPPQQMMSYPPPPQQIPFEELVKVQVPSETVQQLLTMKQYLIDNIGVDLNVTLIPGGRASSILSASQNMGMGMGMGMHPQQMMYNPNAPPQYNQPPHGMMPMQSPMQGAPMQHQQPYYNMPSGGGVMEKKSDSDKSQGDNITFPVPRSVVGIIIGASGSQLKELSREFKCRVFVEKETDKSSLTRNVVLSGGDHDGRVRCHQKIIAMTQGAPMY